MSTLANEIDLVIQPLPPWVTVITYIVAAVAAVAIAVVIVRRMTRRKGPPPLPRR